MTEREKIWDILKDKTDKEKPKKSTALTDTSIENISKDKFTEKDIEDNSKGKPTTGVSSNEATYESKLEKSININDKKSTDNLIEKKTEEQSEFNSNNSTQGKSTIKTDIPIKKNFLMKNILLLKKINQMMQINKWEKINQKIQINKLKNINQKILLIIFLIINQWKLIVSLRSNKRI